MRAVASLALGCSHPIMRHYVIGTKARPRRLCLITDKQHNAHPRVVLRLIPTQLSPASRRRRGADKSEPRGKEGS